MSQQQRQQQQLLSHSVITALAQARIAHSMVALVRNPCRADSQSRATPRRANPRRVKPGPMRRWRHPTCSPTLPASCTHTNTPLSLRLSTCGLRAASRRTGCRPVPPCHAGGRGVHTRACRTAYRDGLRRGRRHFLSGAPAATLLRTGSHCSHHSPSAAVGSTPSRSPPDPAREQGEQDDSDEEEDVERSLHHFSLKVVFEPEPEPPCDPEPTPTLTLTADH